MAVEEKPHCIEKVLFKSHYDNQVCTLRPAVLEEDPGYRVRFDKGRFTTDVPFEIEKLRERAKKTTPGCKVEEVLVQYVCSACEKTFPEKNQINGHITRQHLRSDN